MNDDYLWDKSGDPDPQIQQLEEILGTLRYQPKPLKLTQTLATSRPRRNYLPLFAIAAAVVIASLTAGLWLQRQTRDDMISPIAIAAPAHPAPGAWTLTAGAKPPREIHKPRVVRFERQEALAAKQQLMYALRLASEKLNSAHRRTQDRRSSYENTLPN